MTKYRQSNPSEFPTASEIIKTIIFLALVVWWTHQVFGNKATAAAVVQNAPAVTQFNLNTTNDRSAVVSSWYANGVRCTSISESKGVALSCVK